MAEIQRCLEKVRLPITAGHRARLAAAQTDRCPQDAGPEMAWENHGKAMEQLVTPNSDG